MAFVSPWGDAPSGQLTRGRLAVEPVESAALRDNPLGDPSTRLTPVYLPEGYDEPPERRYPVIYWLHGYTGTSLSGLNYNPWSPSLPEAMDAAIASTGRSAILVLVDGFTRFGGSQYVNSSFNGRYEDYVVSDVVGYVDARFRTIPRAEARGVAGKSSGGYGSLVLGMRHPDVFGAVGSVSGDAYFELCYKTDFPRLLGQIAKHGGVRQLLDAFLAAPKKRGDTIAALNVAAMAMAYSPNPASELGFDLPFDTYSGELRLEVWERWEDADPVYLAERYASNLRQLRLLYFEAGTSDEYHLQYGARILHHRLERLDVPHEHVEFDDGHMNVNYRYAGTLGRVLDALEAHA